VRITQDVRIAMRALVLRASCVLQAPRRCRSTLQLPAASVRTHRRCASGVRDGEGAPIGPGAPPGLEGLRLREDGELVDEAGRALNALGATRFDVAVQAIRGAFPTPQDPAESNERAPPGQMLDALVRYPVDWVFQTIAAVTGDDARAAFAAEVAAVVRTHCGADSVAADGVTTATKGAKYVSVRVKARVGSSTQMVATTMALKSDPRVKMAF
jgi:putative lipoic acid-binding regulatory protein